MKINRENDVDIDEQIEDEKSEVNGRRENENDVDSTFFTILNFQLWKVYSLRRFELFFLHRVFFWLWAVIFNPPNPSQLFVRSTTLSRFIFIQHANRKRPTSWCRWRRQQTATKENIFQGFVSLLKTFQSSYCSEAWRDSLTYYRVTWNFDSTFSYFFFRFVHFRVELCHQQHPNDD